MTFKGSSICRNVISSLFFLLLFQVAHAQYDWSELDRKLVANQDLLGKNIVTLVYHGDSLVYKKEMGEFNSKTQAPIASCSKWLTAVCVMQFVDEGKISLDDKVVKYLPEFDKYFKGYITIRQCLSHMTGIADDDKFLKRILERRKYASLEEEVNDFAKRDIRANAGTDFWYGNVGLNIAGRILEVVSKKKFEILIRSKLFQPLGMTKTSFSETEGGPVNPSGGAKSTADDYMKFLVMLLHHGTYNGQVILSEQAFNKLIEVQDRPEQIMYAPKAAQGMTYASGAWVMESKSVPPIQKTPSGPVAAPVLIGTALASPGLFGTWPMIDLCRNYAAIIFVKNFLGEQRAEVDKEIKQIIDQQIGPCK